MSQTLVPNGIPVNFGLKSTSSDYGVTDSGSVLKGFLTQSVDIETGADVEDIRALQGDKVSRNWYDLHDKANLVFVIAGTGIAAAIASSTRSPFKPGTIINISACASQPDLVGSNWECQPGVKIAGDITKSAVITIPLEKRPGITAAQSA